MPQVTVEGRQPKPARRAGRAEPGRPSRAVAAPLPGPAPATAPASPFNPPFAPLSTIGSNQIQTGSSNGGFGSLFSNMPGATSAGLATESSRPILRGLSDAKVRIQENGVGAVDVSDIAQDHAVPIDPLAIQKVDVVRGPGALRFGSQAVGGVVDVNNNRIPTAAPVGGLAAELRSGVTSVNKGWESGLLLDAGGRNAAVHADIYGRSSSDYSIPSYPYLVPPNPAPVGNGTTTEFGLAKCGRGGRRLLSVRRRLCRHRRLALHQRLLCSGYRDRGCAPAQRSRANQDYQQGRVSTGRGRACGRQVLDRIFGVQA